MDNEQRTSHFQCKKHFVSINKNSNRFCTDILFSASYTGYKISIYLLVFEHANIYEIVGFTNGFGESILSIVRFYSFMCNLKKILALVLAFACAFTMFAGAAFTDQADIKATDAVNMLSSLGVITGYTDGSYQPNKVVTRAEMAKMIFVVRNNKIDDSAYQSNYSKLTDISNHWAKGYIKFCESQGIIAGKGNNKFDPDSPVTGVEAAKMLLVVAGYDTDKAGLTGSAWRTNTLKYAGAAGILDDVNAALEQGLPRQYAAQMIYNTLDTNRVKWSKDSESFDDVLNGGVKETVGHAYMGLCADYGTLVSISKDALTIKIDSSYDSDNYHQSAKTSDAKFTKVDTDYTSLLGQKVKVMFKDGKTNNVLGVYAISDNTVYTTLMNEVELDGSKIKFDGQSYSVDDSKKIDTYFIGVNGTEERTGDAKVTTAYFDKDAKTANADASNGNTSLSEVTFVDSDGDNKIDTAIVIEKTAAKVTYASSSEIVAGDTYKAADENIAEGFAKDDYAVVSKNLYKDNKDVVKADVLNDTINGFKNKTGYVQYKIGSTWYNAEKAFSDVDTGDKVKAYVVNGVALDISSDDSNGALPTVAVVTGTNASGDTINGDQVKLTFFDGTTKTVALDKVVLSDGKTASTAALGTAYSYSESKDGYKLTQLSAKKYNDYEAQAVIASFANYDTKNGTAYSAYSKYSMDDNAKVVLVQKNGKCKVVTGKQFKALASADQGQLTSAFTKETNGLTKIMLASAYVGDIDKTGHSNDNYAYIVKAGYKTGDDRTAYTIWDGEKNVDVVEKVSYVAGARDKGMVIGYSSVDEDGYINDVQTYAVTALPAATKDYKTTELYAAGVQGVNGDSWVTVDGENKLNITKDTKILNVDSAADKDEEIGKPGTALFEAEEIADSGKYYVNAYFVMDETFGSNDDADLAFIVFDVKGKMDGQNESSKTITVAGSGITAVNCTEKTFEAGKTYDLVLTGTASSDVTVSLTGAVFAADGKTASQKVTFNDKGNATIKVIALGSDITVKGA